MASTKYGLYELHIKDDKKGRPSETTDQLYILLDNDKGWQSTAGIYQELITSLQYTSKPVEPDHAKMLNNLSEFIQMGIEEGWLEVRVWDRDAKAYKML